MSQSAIAIEKQNRRSPVTAVQAAYLEVFDRRLRVNPRADSLVELDERLEALLTLIKVEGCG